MGVDISSFDESLGLVASIEQTIHQQAANNRDKYQSRLNNAAPAESKSIPDNSSVADRDRLALPKFSSLLFHRLKAKLQGGCMRAVTISRLSSSIAQESNQLADPRGIHPLVNIISVPGRASEMKFPDRSRL